MANHLGAHCPHAPRVAAGCCEHCDHPAGYTHGEGCVTCDAAPVVDVEDQDHAADPGPRCCWCGWPGSLAELRYLDGDLVREG